MPTPTAALPVRSLYKRLLRSYGPQKWWPANQAWEMMVGAILVQNTAWRNVQKAMASLKKARAVKVVKIARMPRKRLETLIHSSGTFRQKAHRLKLFARAVLKDPSFTQDRARLLAQPGIGPETADSILLYAHQQPYFVVDAYTRRLGRRLGWFRTEDYDRVQTYFQDRLPRDPALYNEFHALIVRHAKVVCWSRRPPCPRCPIKRQCAYGRRVIRSHKPSSSM